MLASPIKSMMPAGSGTPTIIRVSSPMTSMAQNLVRPGTNVVRVRAPGIYILNLILQLIGSIISTSQLFSNLPLIHKIYIFCYSRNSSRPADQGRRYGRTNHKSHDFRRPAPAGHVWHSSIGSGSSCYVEDQHAGHGDNTYDI